MVVTTAVPRDLEPFQVLILGDGNFSFSLALCRILWSRPSDLSITPQNVHVGHVYLSVPATSDRKIQITTTSFDDRQELNKKYPESKEILAALESERFAAEVTVLHGINAWELRDHFGDQNKFDAVVWNHPHLGTEDFRLHRFLMAHFFSSVASVLKPKHSCVCVSLVEGQETRWDLVAQAARSGLGLTQVAAFDENLWPGYVVKRNKHGGSFKNTHTKQHTGSEMKSHLFRFALGEAEVIWRGLESTDIDVDLLPRVTATAADDDTFIADSTIASEGLTHPAGASADSRSNKSNPVSNLAFSESHTSLPLSLTKPTRKARLRASIPSDLVCPHCGKQLATARGWTQHVHMVHTLQKFGTDWKPDRIKHLSCPHPSCSKSFADSESLWQHEINKHTTVTSDELPTAVDQLKGSGPSSDCAGDDYDYIPCDVCGQAVVKRDWGMKLHLETLKPAVGLDMRCPLCETDGQGRGTLGFIESRALFQHYKFCRSKRSKPPLAVENNNDGHSS
ncbi:hypothetical protein SpCBS45565_g03595 [Spizellomyces sp. 'palustris']|nr:hypothetical protein SpCBS45565_g03595 [Spizellomyces sp. 'palustris']